jgi:hypothetical protein
MRQTLQAVVGVHFDHTAQRPRTWPGATNDSRELVHATVDERCVRRSNTTTRRAPEGARRPNRIQRPDMLGQYSHARVFTPRGGGLRRRLCKL